MRMWMIPPIMLCDKHLLGEHGELHKHRHSFLQKHSMRGRVFGTVHIEPEAMASRHDELVTEMIARGMNHQSPFCMPDISYLPPEVRTARVDGRVSLYTLWNRCEACRRRIRAFYTKPHPSPETTQMIRKRIQETIDRDKHHHPVYIKQISIKNHLP